MPSDAGGVTEAAAPAPRQAPEQSEEEQPPGRREDLALPTALYSSRGAGT